MKTQTNLRIYALVLMGMLLVVTSGCKKDDDTGTSGKVPVVTTSNVSDITSNTAICGGNITSQGSDSVAARGVCWSTSANPTVNDAKTVDFTGVGNFTSLITGLSDSTQYFVRAYATNIKGTGYGETKTFTTLPDETISMNFIGGTDYVTGDVTLNASALFYVGVNASSGVSLNRFKVVRTFNNIPYTVIDSTISSKNFSIQFLIQAYPLAGTERWTFIVSDVAGNSKELSFVITTQESNGEINTYTAVLLGAQLNPNIGSFYSTQNDNVLTRLNADLNQSKVDMIFYYGTTNHSSIVAPASSQLSLVPEFSYILDAGNASHWTVTNQTKFKLVLNSLDWALITNDAQITANAVNLTDMNVNNLVAGNIVAFETASTSSNPGKKGLFKVIAISGTSSSDRSITLEVKIQK
jgi:hypothetical protein